MNRDMLATAAALLALGSVAPYLLGIVRGTTRPARTTYLVKAVVGTTLAVSYVQAGAGATAMTLIVFAGTAALVLLFSARSGRGHWTRIDAAVLSSASVCVVVWLASGNPDVALYASMALKWVAFAPTVVKMRLDPGAEDPTSWALALAGDALNVAALATLTPHVALPVLNELLLTIAALVCIFRWPARNTSSRPNDVDQRRSRGSTPHVALAATGNVGDRT